MSAGAEADLCLGLREEAALYRRAADRAEALTAVLRRDEDVSAGLSDVVALLEAGTEIGKRERAAREAWRRSGVRPGPELAAAMTELRAALEGAARAVVAAEAEAGARHRELTPRLDALLRAEQMRRAYRRTGPRPE